jgi:hypothetical protein
MPWVGFKPTIPASERPKTVHALDRSATVTGIYYTTIEKIYNLQGEYYLLYIYLFTSFYFFAATKYYVPTFIFTLSFYHLVIS